LRLGFLVAPISLLPRFVEVAACLALPPGPSVQLATAEFMREGRYLRHLAYQAGPTRLSVTPCWTVYSCTSKLSASQQRRWQCCFNCPTARQIRPSPRRLLGSEWHPSRCQLGTHVGLLEDRALFGASQRFQANISQDAAIDFAGISSASSEGLLPDQALTPRAGEISAMVLTPQSLNGGEKLLADHIDRLGNARLAAEREYAVARSQVLRQGRGGFKEFLSAGP
jgi:hypothetical protein